MNTDAENLQSSGNTAPFGDNSSNDNGTMRLYGLYLSGSRQETVMGYCLQESDRLDSKKFTNFLTGCGHTSFCRKTVIQTQNF